VKQVKVGAITVTAQGQKHPETTRRASKGVGTSTWPPAGTYTWPPAVTRLSGISMGLEALGRLWGHTSSALVIQASHVRNLSGCSVDAGV